MTVVFTIGRDTDEINLGLNGHVERHTTLCCVCDRRDSTV